MTSSKSGGGACAATLSCAQSLSPPGPARAETLKKTVKTLPGCVCTTLLLSVVVTVQAARHLPVVRFTSHRDLAFTTSGAFVPSEPTTTSAGTEGASDHGHKHTGTRKFGLFPPDACEGRYRQLVT
jgi:hypothetical protein